MNLLEDLIQGNFVDLNFDEKSIRIKSEFIFRAADDRRPQPWSGRDCSDCSGDCSVD